MKNNTRMVLGVVVLGVVVVGSQGENTLVIGHGRALQGNPMVAP